MTSRLNHAVVQTFSFFIFIAYSISAQGVYRPVTPPPQQKPPCGHIGTPPCPFDPAKSRDLPANATADQLFTYSNEQYHQGDKAGAIRSLQRSAALGNRNAKRALGMVYAYGQSVPKDVPRGIALLEEVAKTGDSAAMFHLGHIYEEGKLVPLDQAKATQYMNASAERNFWFAEFDVSFSNELGRGVPHDRQAAIRWMDRAASHTQQETPALYAAFLRRAGAQRFKTADQLADAYFADYVRQHTAYRAPAGSVSPGSPEWWNRVTGNSTSCYFNAPGCPRR